MSKHHFNTTNEEGQLLIDFDAHAKAQEGIILNIFKNNPDAMFTPSMIWERMANPNVPLTSVRRAITNLTKSRKLFKSHAKAMGLFGRPEYLWELMT